MFASLIDGQGSFLLLYGRDVVLRASRRREAFDLVSLRDWRMAVEAQSHVISQILVGELAFLF